MLDVATQSSLPPPGLPRDPIGVSRLRVLKFGGSSLATPAHVRRVNRIVIDAAAAGPVIVVVSAFHGVTDALLECARLADRRDATPARQAYGTIAARHRAAVRALAGRTNRATRLGVETHLRELRSVLRGIRLIGCCPPAALDAVASFGERLAATIVAGHLDRFRPARFVDARDFVVTDDQFTRANVNFAATNRAAREHFSALWSDSPSLVPVMTGFIGRSGDGRTTTVGRNGSDYSAAIIGAALNAASIDIWTDVDGVLSADPTVVPSPIAIPRMTYDDALAMSHAGAKVLHPSTIGPAIAEAIPIAIRNTFNPASPGTVISASSTDRMRTSGTVVATDGLTLLTLRCTARAGRRSSLGRLSHALGSESIDVVLASQACSELTTWMAVRQADAAAALDAARGEFRVELERGVATLSETPQQALVTVVGAAGHDGPGVAGRVFEALAAHAIPMNGFTQGSSPGSVSCLVNASQHASAIRIIHRALFEKGAAAGPAGTAGRDLLDADRRHLLHPLHHPIDIAQTIVWAKGRGSTIEDIDGRTYLDGLSGLWNVHAGHGRTELADAAAEQMNTLAYCSGFAGSSNVASIRLAERLIDLTNGSMQSVFFTAGGAEANESAFKTARFYWKARGTPGKVKIVARDQAYHGLTLQTMSATAMGRAYWNMFEPRVPGFVHVQSCYPYRFQGARDGETVGQAAARELEETILREGADTIAAFVGEPIHGAGGIIYPDDDYWPLVRAVCTRHDVLLIADEIITGFGRTGRWFGISHWDVTPDIITFAKGVTSGYLPLGGMMVTRAIKDAMDDVSPQDRWMHAYTYSGHPACCAVALTNIAILERDGLLHRASAMGARLKDGLDAALGGVPAIGEIRGGKGLLAAVEIVEDRASKRNFDAGLKVAASLKAEMLKRGVFTRTRPSPGPHPSAGDVLFFAPPLVVTEEEIDRLVAAAHDAVHAVTAARC